jgi:hypothetical protein
MRVRRPRELLRLAVSGPAVVLVLAGCAGHASAGGAAGPGAATPSTTPPGTASTTSAPGVTVRTFAPYDASGALSVAVASTGTGSCWTNSIAVSSADAYRCLVGNDIQDPCFAPPVETSPPTVACLDAPWSPATVLTLTQALPAPVGGVQAAFPWALVLANGARCVAATGMVPTVAGVALNYVCSTGRDAGIVKTSGPPHEVHYAAPTGGSLSSVAITTVWQG